MTAVVWLRHKYVHRRMHAHRVVSADSGSFEVRSWCGVLYRDRLGMFNRPASVCGRCARLIANKHEKEAP